MGVRANISAVSNGHKLNQRQLMHVCTRVMQTLKNHAHTPVNAALVFEKTAFNEVNGQLDLIADQLDLINGQLDLINGQLDLIDSQLDLINSQLDLINGQLDLIADQLDLITDPLDLINSQLDLIADQLDLIEHQWIQKHILVLERAGYKPCACQQISCKKERYSCHDPPSLAAQPQHQYNNKTAIIKRQKS